MAKKKRPTPARLMPEQLEAFRAVAMTIVELNEAQMMADDWDGMTLMLNDLFYDAGLTIEQFETFAQVIDQANDTDHRSPK